tara:strand:- start:888 stop:1193 length:306 start_codon:yes stop_codon:yes gene_type:complete
MNQYAIFIQAYNSYLNGALFHKNGKAGAQFLAVPLAQALNETRARHELIREKKSPYIKATAERLEEQWIELVEIANSLRLSERQLDDALSRSIRLEKGLEY